MILAASVYLYIAYFLLYSSMFNTKRYLSEKRLERSRLASADLKFALSTYSSTRIYL